MIVWQAHEGNLSGANIAMLEYIDALQTTFSFLVILPHEGSMRKELDKRAVSVTIIPQYSWAISIPITAFGKRIKKFVRNRLAVKAVMQLLQEREAHLVFTNTLVAYVAAKAAYNLGLPHVWWIHEYGEEDFGFRIGFGQPGKAYTKIEQWSQLVICNSKAVAKKFTALLPAIDVQFIYQPVSWNSFINKSNNLIGRGYLMFGQITAAKGHLDVLQAVVNAKQLGVNVELSIKGPCEQPSYLALLQNFIIEHNLLGHVTIETGFFIKEQVMPLYKVLIVASHSEAFGRVIVEANLAGLYAVVKDIGGAPELVNNSNGVLYSTNDDLCNVFLGKLPLPSKAPLLSYDYEAEINHLKKLLSAIR